jgi:hypothetical protein
VSRPSLATAPSQPLDLWERRAHVSVRRVIYAMFAVISAATAPPYFLQGHALVGLVAIVVAVAMLAGYRLADAEHRNIIAVVILLFINASLLVVSVWAVSIFGEMPPMGVHHVLVICMAFVLIERDQVVLQAIVVTTSLLLLGIELLGWPPTSQPLGEVLSNSVAILGSATGVCW